MDTELKNQAVAERLSELSDREFFVRMGEINARAAEASRQHDAARADLLVLLTEQMSRALLRSQPTAALAFVRVAAAFHSDENGVVNPDCEGHAHRLVLGPVHDADGALLERPAETSPLPYLLERISPLLGLRNHVLDIAARDWVVDIVNP